MNAIKRAFLNANEGNSYWVLGDLYHFKITGKETGGAFTVMEQEIQPQGGPPPHVHRREDEAFYILEGQFSFMYEGKSQVYEAGSFIYIPKGSLHSFKNISDRPGKLLVTVSPAGLEEFFYSIGIPLSESPTSPGFDPAVIGKILELAPQYEMDVLLPKE